MGVSYLAAPHVASPTSTWPDPTETFASLGLIPSTSKFKALLPGTANTTITVYVNESNLVRLNFDTVKRLKFRTEAKNVYTIDIIERY